MAFIKDHMWTFLLVINYSLAIFAAITLMLKKVNPTKTLSYLAVLFAFPFIGLIVYYLFGQEYRKTKIFSRKNVLNQNMVKQIEEEISIHTETLEDIQELLEEKSKLIPLLIKSEYQKLTCENEVKLIKNADEKFDLLLEDVEAAEHHIHLEYFIIKDDKIGTTVLNALAKKAKSGVEVKIVIDDVGSSISSKMRKHLKNCNVQVYPFMPVLFSKFTGKMNYRDHRKIIVIDGKIAYVGGVNISDTYVNAHNDTYWRDTHLRITGEAVKQFQILFFTTLDFVNDRELSVDEEYFPTIQMKKKIPIQIAASGPDTDWSNIMESLFIAICNAEKYICITTPYFIPNDEIILALQIAARSEIEVKIIVPKISDSWIAQYATSSYIQPMLEAGVKFYHYTKGFIHAKTLVVDGVLSSVGTANMDYRSFNINFEVNTLIYNKSFSQELLQMFNDDLKDCEELTLEMWKQRSSSTKIKEAFAKLLAPLL